MKIASAAKDLACFARSNFGSEAHNAKWEALDYEE